MTKDVLLAIKGLQFDASAEESNVQTITVAEYYEKNNSHYVIYDEAIEGTEQSTKNIIKFKDKSLELTKKGFVNVHMLFEENKKSLTNYATPFGDILIGIDAKKITKTIENDTIRVNVDYALEVNYEFLADCKITMEISERKAGVSPILGA
ncbi:MAG: DUF1934 domain-containing protein [Lachnospiraceae bacterium]